MKKEKNKCPGSYAFFAMLDRMRWIRRWSLMKNREEENLAEHSLAVAFIAHALVMIGRLPQVATPQAVAVDPAEVALAAMFHDASEIITGDLPTPIKYHDPSLREAYARVETAASKRLLDYLPDELRSTYHDLLWTEVEKPQLYRYVKAADCLSAYLKCAQEVADGNREFARALQQTREKIDALQMPECEFFLANFAEAYTCSLDDLNPLPTDSERQI